MWKAQNFQWNASIKIPIYRQNVRWVSWKANDFFTWIDLTGVSGINNYLHFIGSCHMHHFFGQYRNLYKFSQQGWEHMNKCANGVYWRHSQKGGKIPEVLLLLIVCKRRVISSQYSDYLYNFGCGRHARERNTFLVKINTNKN